MKRMIPLFVLLALVLAGCGRQPGQPATHTAPPSSAVQSEAAQTESTTEPSTEPTQEDTQMNNETNALGGLTPEDALEYLKNTPDVVIVQVNTAEWKIEPGFTGALWIPHDEIAERYDEIPEGKPVLLHCGAGVVSVPAYETLLEKRPDIPELSYIAGSPRSVMDGYNEWLAEQ